VDFAVTQLDSSDWQRGRAVRLRALAESPAAFGSVLGVEQRLDDSVWPQRVTPVEAATFVAVSDSGEDVGLIVGAPDDDDAGLFSMGVASAARQSGVGGRLVEVIIAWATASGHHRILLEVGEENAAAIALYANCGFEPTGKSGSLPPPRDHTTEHQRALVLSRPNAVL